MNKPAPTLKDVAAAAKVSLATASLALRGKAPASKATQQRVQAIAEKLGYRANPAIAAMATRQRHRLNTGMAVITTNPAGHPARFRKNVQALKEACDKLGMDAQVYDTQNYPDGKALSRRLFDVGVQGVFLQRVAGDRQWWSSFEFAKFSVISLDRDFSKENPDFHLIRLAFSSMFTRIWEECRQRGYRRIAPIVYHPLQANPDHENFLAMALWKSWRENRVTPLELPTLDEAEVREMIPQARRWLAQTRPDAVILQSPALLSLIEGSDLPYVVGWEADGPHTGVRASEHRLAAQCGALMDMLIRSRLRGPQPEAYDVVVAADWHEGTSLPPR